MKFLKGISFFVLNIVWFAVGIWLGMKGDDFFYPGSDGSLSGSVNYAKPDQEGTDLVIMAGSMPERITADTCYEIIECDLNSGISQSRRESVPVPYIGMSRELFMEEMERVQMSPPLSELERGFVSLAVTRFSTGLVTVEKYYRQSAEEQEFWLTVEDHYVMVYLGDHRTRYEYTTIYVPYLPESLQQELLHGKSIIGEKNLYNFLESYTS